MKEHHHHHQHHKHEEKEPAKEAMLEEKAHEGHNSHHDHHAGMMEDFKRRFWVSTILSVPVVLLSPMIQEIFGYEWTFSGANYLLLALSTIVYVYGGWPFLKGLAEELGRRQPGMMTLIGVAITTAYGYSAAVAIGLEGKMFFWELVTLIDIMLIGHYIEMRSVMGASRALEMLVDLMPAEAHLIDESGNIRDVSIKELKKQDSILVKPGEKIPADGIITEGESHIDESMLTGESVPVKKSKGAKVIGGAINGNGSLKVQVEHTGAESYLNKVVTLVQEAQASKSRTQHLANRTAAWLTYIAIGIGFITLVTWLLLDFEFVFALERMVTVMVISCPHALGLAVPLVVAISTSIAARKGLLIRNRTAFENSRKITAMVFDKTGTLTKGKFGVTRVETVNTSYSAEDLLKLAGALEQQSEHPIAVGIVRHVKEKQLEMPTISGFEAITGKGIQAQVGESTVRVVSPGYLKENNIPLPEKAYGGAAETVVFVLINDELAGYIALADEVRPESAEAVRTFKENGMKVYMATGDNKKIAKEISDMLGLDGFYAEVLPHQKVNIIKELQQKGEYVAMTGDGVNDAPALAQADVGIAVGSGTDIAAETADIILVNSNPKDILNLVLFGRATYAKMVQNLVWATAYNAIAIPLAAGVLYSAGFVMSPAAGAVLMSLSTVVVAINAQLLKKRMK